jgi:hypothetical protein
MAEQGEPLTRASRPVTNSYVAAEHSYLGAYWFFLFLVALSIVSLGCALFGYGVVFQLEAGFLIYHKFYSYMLMFPLVGILLLVLFGLAATDRRSKTIGFVLTIFSVIYLILVGGVLGYMIYDWIVNCGATNAAPHCWNGTGVRWQFYWVFFSIAAQLVFMIVALVIGIKVLGIASRLMTVGVVESRIPQTRIESRQKSPQRLSDYDPITRQFIHAVNNLK